MSEPLSKISGVLWDNLMPGNTYQLYRVAFNQFGAGGNWAEVTWGPAAVPAWAGIYVYDDNRSDSNGPLALGKETFATTDPLFNSTKLGPMPAFPDCATAVIKVKELSPYVMSPVNQGFVLSADAGSLTWAAPVYFGRASTTTWSNGTANCWLINAGGVAAFDVTMTVRDLTGHPLMDPILIADRVAGRAKLLLTVTPPASLPHGTTFYVFLDYHYCGEHSRTMLTFQVPKT